ncbi:MAG: hypothetical protein M3P18_18400 [Actinomycetota bacterium]|nr:hypothetical protein [Actinomycetota bacterium]
MGSETTAAILTREGMRIALVITVVGMLASGESSEAQRPGRRAPAAVAERFIDAQLSDSAFRLLRCVSARVGDCPGGVLIVRGYRLGDGVRTPDTVRYAVEFQVVGIVGVSEGGPFFMPRSWVDSAEVLVVRRARHWMVRLRRGQSDERVRTTADVARGYFDLDATDRSLLDTAVAVPRRP